LILAAVLCVAGFIAMVEFQSHRSQRDVVATIAELSPGTPFSTAMQRLGQPTQTFTNGEQIVSWLASVAPRADARLVTNLVLHVFVHQGPPYRYVLVYTDRESKGVVQTDWCAM
jgi:lysophospholipase L1-like esterase